MKYLTAVIAVTLIGFWLTLPLLIFAQGIGTQGSTCSSNDDCASSLSCRDINPSTGFGTCGLAGGGSSGCAGYTSQPTCQSNGCNWNGGDINTPPTCSGTPSGGGTQPSGAQPSGAQPSSGGGTNVGGGGGGTSVGGANPFTGLKPGDITPPPAAPQGAPLTSVSSVVNLVNTILLWVSGVFWIAAAGFVFYAAYLYLTASGNPERVSKAHRQLLWAVVAIAIGVLAAGLPTLIKNLLGGR